MKKFLGIVALVSALTFTGCGSSSTDNTQDVETDLSNSIGSAYADISGFGGFIDVDLALKFNDGIDVNSFLITHSIDGVSTRLYVPTVLNNGSLMFVQELVVVRANETSSAVTHTVEVNYFDKGVSKVYTFTVGQKTEQAEADAIGSEAVSEYVLLNPVI